MTLFDIAVLAAALVWGAGLVWCYRLGLRDGLRAARGEAPVPVGTGGGRAKAGQPTAEQKRYDAILANIDAYDGTEKGQREVI